MFTTSVLRTLLLTLALVVVLPTTASAQGPCDAPCGMVDVFCAAQRQDCRNKLALYKGYMAQLGIGVTLYSLPQRYIDLLNPWFLGPDLKGWRFGFSDRQPPGNATTDCSITYFNDRTFVANLRGEFLSTDSDFHWLFHELQHFVQCRRVNGRDWYANMWFRDLELGMLGAGNLAEIHDAMPMEGEADTVADRVLSRVEDSRDSDGFVRRTSTGSSTTTSSGTNSSAREVSQLHVGAVPSNGQINVETNAIQWLYASTPRFEHDVPFKWELAEPNRGFSRISGNGPRNSRLLWTPTAQGVHKIRITAGTFGTQEYATRVLTVNVSAPNQGGSGSGSSQAPTGYYYETVNEVPASLGVQLIVRVSSPINPVTICVSNSLNGLLYSRAMGNGSALFRVPKNQSVTVIVSGSGPQSGLRGQSVSVEMETTQKTINVTLARGSGGLRCGAIQ